MSFVSCESIVLLLQDSVDLLADFWLARVDQEYSTVDDENGTEVLGLELDEGDEYLIVTYLEFVETTAAGGRKYEIREGYPQTVLWEQGSIVPYKLKARMKKGEFLK